MKIDKNILSLPKAELHVHIEGTVTRDMALKKAAEHNITLPDDIFSDDGKSFVWNDFVECVTKVYDAVANTIRTKQDFSDITYDYLERCADDGVLYVELIASPEHCGRVGLSYPDMIEGIAEGIDKAKKEKGIEARINVALVRHLSDDDLLKNTNIIAGYDHPYIVGLDLAGAESNGDVSKFRKYFKIIKDATNGSKGMRIHATENSGPLNGWQALDLKVKRLGHGVRSIEDPKLLDEFIKRDIVLEVAPTSNILAGIYPSFDQHPLRDLYDKGVKVTLNSDDPGLFGNSVATEYQIAKDEFGFTDLELLNITRTAIEASFADDTLKSNLMKKVDQFDFFLRSRHNRPGPSISGP
jgi:adenosine deaminase